jgi:predicted aspartyl protease
MSRIAVLLIAAIFPIAGSAQAGCPAGIQPIPFHKVNQHQMVVGVSINQSGPYDFLLDTGTQMTVVDLALAADLNLKSTGKATVAGVSFQGPALFSTLDRFDVGGHTAANQPVLVYDMKNVQNYGFAIRGLLGEDFLSRYDVLIDREHDMLCIDDTGAMLASMRRDHGPLVSSAAGVSGGRSPSPRGGR